MASPTQAGFFALQADRGQRSVASFAAYLVVAGLVNALIAVELLCRLPESHTPSFAALFVRASLYVSMTCVAGVTGARFYWNRSSTPFVFEPPLSFARFALANAAGWVWVPAVVLLSGQDSLAAPGLAAFGAGILAMGLRKAVPSVAPVLRAHGPASPAEKELFAESLQTPPGEAHGCVIAVGIYAAIFAFQVNATLEAAGLAALCAYLVAWTLTPDADFEVQPKMTSCFLRWARMAAVAVVVTVVVLFVGVAARNRAEAYALAHGSGAAQGGEADRKPAHPAKEAGSGVSGYESIILWPAPEKKQIFAPLPAWSLSLAEQAAKPLVIRFDGVYWYFQEPEKRPGPHAHQAHGNPVALDIEARNFAPLQMEAHQNLGSPIRLTRCREIQVAIENRNGGPGGLSLGVLLTDSASRGKPTLSLGQQPVASSLPGEFLNKPAAVSQTLRFRVPASARIRKFDEITVLFQPDGQDFKVGPRIAIREFQLIPR